MTDQDPTRDRSDPGLASTAPHAGADSLPGGTDARPGGAATGKDAEMTTDDAATHPLDPVIPEVAASLTDALRAMYDNVVDEPLPDAFAQLLSQLDDTDG